MPLKAVIHLKVKIVLSDVNLQITKPIHWLQCKEDLLDSGHLSLSSRSWSPLFLAADLMTVIFLNGVIRESLRHIWSAYMLIE